MRIRMTAVLGALALAACGGGDEENGGERLRSMAQREATCVTAADCCVVIDGCLATAYVVTPGDYEEAIELADRPRNACVGCISPSVEVRCEAGTCVGVEIEDFDSAAYLANAGNHCGAAIGESGQALSSDPVGGSQPRAEVPAGRMFGCGVDDE